MPNGRSIFRVPHFDTLLMRGRPSLTAWRRACVRELANKHGRGGLRNSTGSFVPGERRTIERLHMNREDPGVRSGKMRVEPGESFSHRFIMRVDDQGGGDGGE